jgi:hypothetical protein
MAESVKASVFAIKRETTTGELIEPSVGADFIPLRAGFEQTAAFEEIESDELVNDIGASEPSLGKETPTGTHPAYLKGSTVEGQAPEAGLLIESCLGDEIVNATEYSTDAGSTAGNNSSRAKLAMAGDEEDNFVTGQGVLIKDLTNGYSVRNVDSVDSAGNGLDLNFNLENAPGAGVGLGKAILYRPVSSGFPSFSAWLYSGNGGAVQAMAGCQTSSMTLTFPAGQQAEIEFSYDGTKAFYNPFVIGATNKFIDFVDSGGTKVAILDETSYRTPIDMAEAIVAKMNAVSVDTISSSYDNVSGQFTISSDNSPFSLLWNSGANAANTIGDILGYDTSADDTGAQSYTGDNAIDLAAQLVPEFDNASNIVVKNAELMIGDFFDNICVQASNVTITVDRPNVDVDDLCAESGVAEKVAESRTVTMSSTLVMNRYESKRFDSLVKNRTQSIMMNAGPKDGANNWIPGSVVNAFMQNAKITTHNLGGDTYVTVGLEAKGFVSSDKKDLFINFL